MDIPNLKRQADILSEELGLNRTKALHLASKLNGGLLAIAHNSSVDGWEFVDFCEIPYKPGMNLAAVKEEFRRIYADGYTDDPEDVESEVKQIKGAWVIDRRTFEILSLMTGNAGSDTGAAVETMNMKIALNKLAVKRLGRKV